MPRLAKNYYRTKDGGKKINCYMANIPKELVHRAGIEDEDEIAVYEDYGTIVIAKRWYCTCMECDYEWESGQDRGLWALCPNCHCGDVKFEERGEIK